MMFLKIYSLIITCYELSISLNQFWLGLHQQLDYCTISRLLLKTHKSPINDVILGGFRCWWVGSSGSGKSCGCTLDILTFWRQRCAQVNPGIQNLSQRTDGKKTAEISWEHHNNYPRCLMTYRAHEAPGEIVDSTKWAWAKSKEWQPDTLLLQHWRRQLNVTSAQHS